VQVKEASLQLRRDLDRLEVDPVRLEALEQRLADVHRLARKHQTRPEELPAQLAALKEELAAIAQGAESTEDLRQELEQVTAAFWETAQTLSARRKAAATPMQERISQLIRELGMPQGRVEVAVQTDESKEPAPYGCDAVEFLVSANPGMPLRPLARVASGGELSRISLAIQVAATDSKTVPTLIFDEVDTGIGGGIAEIVGQKLRILGRGRQVLCVTHLAQVASQGHHHLLVEKLNESGVTHSTVRELAGEERTREVARMLGGVRITEQSLAHAGEMLSLAAGH
jgi:DNA repair protein RecN (Recombination protein N)